MAIKKAAVIGAGVMGSGIAAHIANAGVPVILLDIVKPGAADRSAIARGGGRAAGEDRSGTADARAQCAADHARQSGG